MLRSCLLLDELFWLACGQDSWLLEKKMSYRGEEKRRARGEGEEQEEELKGIIPVLMTCLSPFICSFCRIAPIFHAHVTNTSTSSPSICRVDKSPTGFGNST